MADSTPANADTLRRELQKVVTEIVYDGGGEDGGETKACFGVVKAIDDAIRILTCLRKVESKKPESDISPVAVPKEFICTLSNAIMIEPVIIASGQTFEKRYITEWLRYERTCPKTKQVLPHRFWVQNHLIDELITKWCLVNKFDRPKHSHEIVTELFTGYLEPLLQRISSPLSVADQTEAAKELSRQTRIYSNVRDFFVAKLPDSITRLLTPLSILGEEVDSNPELQENIVTALFHILTAEKNKTVVAEKPHVLPLLTKSLKQGTVVTRRTAAATLLSLSFIDSNKLVIGNSESLKVMIDVIEEGDILAASTVAHAVHNLCIVEEIKEKAVLEGLTLAVTKNIKAGSNVDGFLSLLALIATLSQAVEELDNLGFIYHLFRILRNSRSLANDENALMIVSYLCEGKRGMSKREVVEEEENLYGTFTKLVKKGSYPAAEEAEEILEWIKRSATGQEPRRA